MIVSIKNAIWSPNIMFFGPTNNAFGPNIAFLELGITFLDPELYLGASFSLQLL